jgi:cysteinyl-tRNA synthetase
MPLHLYNTLTRKAEPFRPADPSHVTFYTCGPTVYDDAHIGNFRSFLAADVLRRWIESPLCEVMGPDGRPHKDLRRVTHVMNITDVGHMTDDAEGGEQGEDRMAVAGRRIEEAKKSGKLPAGVDINPRDPYQIARFYEARFKEDARKLGLKVAIEAEEDPSLMPRATDNVQGMITVIARLIERGFAYVVGQPGARVVYFDVQKFGPYGRLSGNTLEALRAGAGGRVAESNQAQKRNAADFLLWKEDASHIMKWESPWGAGYPGWHIECTAMSVSRLLGTPPLRGGTSTTDLLASLTVPDGQPLIDLHSGGEDNIFPHHECEIAQSCGAFNADPAAGSFSSLWFHPRFLLVEGTKMSKSKGNFYTQRDLFEKGIEPAALRLELIKTHYRSNANFTFQGLQDSQRTVERWRRFLKTSDDGSLTMTPWYCLGECAGAEGLVASFTSAMNDDLNVAQAVASINEWLNSLPSSGLTNDHTRVLDGLAGEVLGVLELEAPASTTSDIGLFAPGVAPDPAVIAKLEERRAARAAKDFKRSDQIRDELAAMGYAIKDVAGGKVEVRRA